MCTHERSTVVQCNPGIQYFPVYYWSRYPLELSKLWNLKNLLTPVSWFVYLITIMIVLFVLKLSVNVGMKLGLKTFTEEISLVPFRCMKWFITYCLINCSSLLCRISLTENQTTNLLFEKGFSSNFIFLLWAVFGGFMM